MKAKTLIISALFLAFVMGGMALMADRVTGAGIQTLMAAKVAKAPAALDDPLWQKAKPLDVPFEGKEKFAGKKANVIAQAVYTDTDVFFLFKWKDATKSVTKGAWQFDGEKWTHLKGDEDRISMLFEINRINNFATKGCAVTCHGPAGAPMKDFKFATATAAEKGDLWQWKAARSDPYKSVDDGWLTKAEGQHRPQGRRRRRRGQPQRNRRQVQAALHAGPRQEALRPGHAARGRNGRDRRLLQVQGERHPHLPDAQETIRIPWRCPGRKPLCRRRLDGNDLPQA